MALSILLRLLYLSEKPAHFDEGVNGWFLNQMKTSVVYNYDHQNYHGPLHFYVTLPFISALGETEFALRLPPVIFSVATTALLLCFSSIIGRLAGLLSAIFWAISPASVFYSRYGIHESELAFFVALWAFSLAKIYLSGETKWITLAAISLVGGILTKETFFINMMTLPMAVFSVFLLNNVAPPLFSRNVPPPAPQKWSWLFMASVVFVSVLVVEAFYSSWGTRSELGWSAFLKSYIAWSETGSKGSGHVKAAYDIGSGLLNYYWMALLTRYEWPFIISIASAFVYWKSARPASQIILCWALGTIVAYSIIPYKTPWCILSMMPAISLATGAFLSIPFLGLGKPVLSIALPSLLAISPLPYTIYLNFKNFDNPKEPYVYVQTSREVWRFLGELRVASQEDPRFKDLPGMIALDSYYPLPWWLSSYSKIDYRGEKASLHAPGKHWAIASAKRLDEFLSENDEREWRYYRFKLRDAQDDAVAFFDRKTSPKEGVYIYPKNKAE
jgi:uncharacterized protein (TIGR03663 family)